MPASLDDMVTAEKLRNQVLSLLVSNFADQLPAIATLLSSINTTITSTFPQVTSISAVTFTCAAAATTTVTAPGVAANSTILLMPTNAAAGTLMAGATSLYISVRTANTSFTVATANGGAAAGTETFQALVIGM